MKIASNPRFWLLALVALVLMVVFSTLPSESASGQELDAMLQLLTERVNRSPEHSDSWRMLGKRYIQLGHVEDAIKALETSLQLDPESAASHCDLGRLLLSTGDRQQAELHFQQVALLAPTSSYAKNLAAEGLVVIGPTDESSTAEYLTPDNPSDPTQLAGFQMQTFDGADNLAEQVQKLEGSPQTKARRWRAFLETGVMYNSNVSLTPTSRELRSLDAASAQGFINPDIEWIAMERGPLRLGALTRGYFTLNESTQRAFNLASFQGGVFGERDFFNQRGVGIGRAEYLYVLDLLDSRRFGDRHTLTLSMTSLRDQGGLVYLYGSSSFAQFDNDGVNPTTDSLDGTTWTVGVSRMFPAAWWRLENWSIGADAETARTEGLDYRYYSTAMHLSSNWRLNTRWTVTPEFGIGFRNYYDFTGVVNRDETIGRLGLRSKFQVNPLWSVSAVASYDRFASDNANFDAERTQLGMVTTLLY